MHMQSTNRVFILIALFLFAGRAMAQQPSELTVAAGTGTAGYSGDGGAATAAQLNGPYDVDVDGAGNLYIAEWYNSRIRKVNASTGVITTIAGTGGRFFSGDGDGATSADLNSPEGVVV